MTKIPQPLPIDERPYDRYTDGGIPDSSRIVGSHPGRYRWC